MTPPIHPNRPPLSGGRPRQLVVVCHGVGASGSLVIGLADAWRQALPDALFVAPDAPFPGDGAPDPRASRQWFSLADRTPAVLHAGAAAALPFLDGTIDGLLAAHGLAPDRLALVGFSQGAMMALHAGLRRRPDVAAILAYAGAMLPMDARATTSRILLVHGEADDVVPPERSVQAREALSRAGARPRLLLLPGIGHAIDPVGIGAGLAALREAFR